MRRLIESLTPDACRIDWKWIGAMFVFYVAVMAVAASLLVTHHTAKGAIMQSSIGVVVCKPCMSVID